MRSPRRVRPSAGVARFVRRFESAEPPEQRRAVVVVHVDHGEVRLPVGQDRLRLGQVAGRADEEDAVVERQLDQVDDQLADRGARARGGRRRTARPRRVAAMVHRELPALEAAVPGGSAPGDHARFYVLARGCHGHAKVARTGRFGRPASVPHDGPS